MSFHRIGNGRSRRCTVAVGAALTCSLLPSYAAPPISASNWGDFTAPVYGVSEAAPYSSADLFAGPLKFQDADYYHGVLPNGKIVSPAGHSVQIGMNPLGATLTPDGRYLITSNDDERDDAYPSIQNSSIQGGYSLSVLRASDMQLVSQIACGPAFIGLQVSGSGPYRVYVSGGGSNSLGLYDMDAQGKITDSGRRIVIPPLLPPDAGYVSNYRPASEFSRKKQPLPASFDRQGAQITFPAGSALSPDGKYLYVACDGDNSLAVIDTASNSVIKQIPVGYFPYGVAVSADGKTVMVTNWGIQEYRFLGATYDAAGELTGLQRLGPTAKAGLDRLFFLPLTSTSGQYPKTSSVSIVSANEQDGQWLPVGNVYEGRPLDPLYQVGDTHPSAVAVVRNRRAEVLYVAKANSDSLGLIDLDSRRSLPDFDLSLFSITLRHGQQVHGSYPDALVASADGQRLYVAEAGLNSVAVLDTSRPERPRLIGRIPTGWYPSALALSDDALYVVNAYGIGEDIDPSISVRQKTAAPLASGIVEALGGEHKHDEDASFVDSNYLFGSAQKVDLKSLDLNDRIVMKGLVAYHPVPASDRTVVPIGGRPSGKIKHVIFILHENKTFDSMLGSEAHFGPYASTQFVQHGGQVFADMQYTPLDPNTRLLATSFATAVNYYSDAEESDVGHQYCASGTASDYTEKTFLVKEGRGMLVQKNYDAEDYPAGGYLFNNAARNGVSYKDYGDMVRIAGMDKGDSQPTITDDPPSGKAGLPALQADNVSVSSPLKNIGDVDSPTAGVGLSFFVDVPMLKTLGDNNPDGEPHIDRSYPGYNFNISDQRRAREFIADFDRMVKSGTLPQFLFIYEPNDHTGGLKTPNRQDFPVTGMEQVADGDAGLGMVVQHLMSSSAYYDAKTGEGSAIFITYDDAQSTRDHIHPHRTPLILVSPYAKPGYLAAHHYSTASIVKTEELLLGLPPNNLGDLLATDLRDMFQDRYNGVSLHPEAFSRVVRYISSEEGRRVWALVDRLDTSAPDRDSQRLGILNRLCAKADALHTAAVHEHRLESPDYRAEQAGLYQVALRTVAQPAPRDDD